MSSIAQPAQPVTVRVRDSYRWLQLLVGILCMAMIANLQYGWTLFVNPLDAKYHWGRADRKSTRLNSSHRCISYAVFCLKKKRHTLGQYPAEGIQAQALALMQQRLNEDWVKRCVHNPEGGRRGTRRP